MTTLTAKPATRTCCRRERPASDFYAARAGQPGTRCKACKLEQDRYRAERRSAGQQAAEPAPKPLWQLRAETGPQLRARGGGSRCGGEPLSLEEAVRAAREEIEGFERERTEGHDGR